MGQEFWEQTAGVIPSILLVPLRIRVKLGQQQHSNWPVECGKPGAEPFASCCLHLFIRTFSLSWWLQERCDKECGKHSAHCPAHRRREQKLEGTLRARVQDPQADGKHQCVRARKTHVGVSEMALWVKALVTYRTINS